jgi:hypothetical protein
VYDVLSVLVAADVVIRTADRRIVWNWLLGASAQTIELVVEMGRQRAAVATKRRQLEDLRRQAASLKRILIRNSAPNVHLETPLDRIPLPFMVIAMNPSHASARAETENDARQRVRICLGGPFELMDDQAILAKLPP